MDNEMKMRATMQGDVADVKVLIKHIMETGLRKDPTTKQFIPAHFINQVVASLNGVTVLDMQWGVAVSKNPFFGFKVKGAKPGDKITVNAVDNLGTKFYGETAVA
ncbi:MAG: Sulfur oxidation protein SoxZ [Candidatus Gallionella acididurans]|uniref:Sulfur oxidation protein SoxZ n=1 Tax=Candidatus Gallionella acididurans TaxID=1796491 RepID=A0A139BP51_9PROT|nr:MAG: Sulfur oxidation protein SoxZ [Candidatus Gallionella acididurans]